ncbi:hypothetical protein ABPG75_009500 [Micractinium tetrahymenae]
MASVGAAPRAAGPERKHSGEQLAGPALGVPAVQMSYATGRGGRAASPVRVTAAPLPASQAKPQAAVPVVPRGSSASWQPGTPSAPAARHGIPPQEAQREEDEVVPPPPQPPVVLPSSAAAVRVKEQVLQPPLAVRSGYVPAEGADAGDEYQSMGEEEEAVDAPSDAAWLGQGQAEDEQAPGLLAKAAEVAGTVAATVTNAAAAAVEAAAPVVKSVVGQGAEAAASGFDAAKETAEAVAESMEEDEEEAAARQAEAEEAARQEAAAASTQQRGMVPGQRPVLPSPPTPTAGTARAAVTTAAVLPASAASPASTGRGYFPTVGAAVPVPKPAPRPSGELEARKVVAERLTGLAEEAALRTPTRRAGAGAAARGGAAGMEEDWISQLVERLWPYIKAAVEQQAWAMLPDILEASEPSWIHDINLKKFELGPEEPDLSNIRVFVDDNDVMEDAYIEFDFEWHSKQDVELQIQVLPSSMDKAWIPNFIEDKLKALLDFTVGVEDAMLKGSIRVTLRPLLRRVPVVGAVQVSFVQMPEFDFDLTLGGSTNVPLEPALKSWIKQTLQDQVLRTYVTPEHYFLQIDPEAQDLETPVGVLSVEVVEARKVPKMDLLTRSSPFVEMFVRTSQRRVTSTKNNTKRPRWGERFDLPVHVPEHQELTMVLYDYDWASANDEIGRAFVTVADLQPGQERDLWLEVSSESEEELKAAKQDMSKRDKAKVAAAKPLLQQSTKGCQLHVKVTYHAFSDAEEKLIVAGRQQGMQAVLNSPQGRAMNPHLRALLMSGMVQLKVPRADSLPVSSLFGRPSVNGVVRCGDEHKELPAVKASRHGSVQFDQPVEVHLGPDATQSPAAEVVLELKQGGWFGGGEVGRVRLRVQDLIKRGHIHQGFRLEGAETGRVEVEAHWRPYFY